MTTHFHNIVIQQYFEETKPKKNNFYTNAIVVLISHFRKEDITTTYIKLFIK